MYVGGPSSDGATGGHKSDAVTPTGVSVSNSDGSEHI